MPADVTTRFKEAMIDRGEEMEKDWQARFDAYAEAYPELAKQLQDAFENKLPENWASEMPVYNVSDDAKASRVTSSEMIQALSKTVPTLWGGSADLSSSNNTMMKDEKDFEPGQYEGRNIWFGVREFAMAAAMNGIALHGGTQRIRRNFLRLCRLLTSSSQTSSDSISTCHICINT